MLCAKELRSKENLLKIDSNPGYYKWWAAKDDFEVILKKLNIQFDDIIDCVEVKENLYCIYVGIAANETVRDRLNWHVNDKHSESRVINGTLSTLRQSISSIIAGDQFNKQATNEYIDKLFIEYFINNNPVKSENANIELHEKERSLLQSHYYILNIQENHHPYSLLSKDKLRKLRKESKTLQSKKS